MKSYIKEDIPERDNVYNIHVTPLQTLFKSNMKYAIKKKGYTYRGFAKMLKQYTGIQISVNSLIYIYPNRRGSNNLYYFCAIAHLLNIPVIDLFREDFISTYQETKATASK